MGEILDRRPLAPARHRLSVDALYRLVEAGILTDPHRVELIDGELIDMAAIGSPHAAITNRLVRCFARAVADGLMLVSVQNPLQLDGYNEPQPDLMLLRPRADGYRAGHPNAADVLLLVEVSEPSLAYDRNVKLPLAWRAHLPS
jgi:Uma2 family endonuclease